MEENTHITIENFVVRIEEYTVVINSEDDFLYSHLACNIIFNEEKRTLKIYDLDEDFEPFPNKNRTFRGKLFDKGHQSSLSLINAKEIKEEEISEN